MNFRPELAEKVMAGDKTVTRRLASENPRSPWYQGRCAYRVGQRVAICPGRGQNRIGDATVIDVELMTLGHLTDEEARREGFVDAASFEAAFAGINGSYDPDVEVWRIALDEPVRGEAEDGR